MTFQSFGFWVFDFFSVTTAVSPCSRGFPLGIARLEYRGMMALAMTLAAALPVPGRSVAASPHGVAASSQPLAAQAAVQILLRGGNAVDAAIAANSTQGLMEPTSNGIGGDLFAIVYLAKEDKLYGLNASGWSPSGMTLDFLHGKGVQGELPYRGVYTVTVPGAVGGWAAMHKRFGKLPLATDLAPAS